MEAVVLSPKLHQVVRALKKAQPSEIAAMIGSSSLSAHELKAVQGKFAQPAAGATAANYWN